MLRAASGALGLAVLAAYNAAAASLRSGGRWSCLLRVSGRAVRFTSPFVREFKK